MSSEKNRRREDSELLAEKHYDYDVQLASRNNAIQRQEQQHAPLQRRFNYQQTPLLQQPLHLSLKCILFSNKLIHGNTRNKWYESFGNNATICTTPTHQIYSW